MIGALCEPHKKNGRLIAAQHVVGKTPMCNECFLESKRVPVEPQKNSAAAALEEIVDEARENHELRQRHPAVSASDGRRNGNNRRTPAKPGKKRKREEEGETVANRNGKHLGIDWEEVQRKRNDGLSVANLALEYGCHVTSIYMNTKAPKGARKPRAAAAPRASVATKSRTGGDYDAVLADLIAKRDKLNVAIDALQEL